MSQFDLCISLAMPYQIPNPDAQGTITVRERNDALRKLFRQGIITEQQLTDCETDTIPDPDYKPLLDRQSRLDAILDTTGGVISITELQAALA
jgi:hypothetical protein